MVKEMVILWLLIIWPFCLVRGQSNEYVVENVDDISSYYYCESSMEFSSLISSKIMIRVMDTKGNGIQTNVYFLDGENNNDTIVVSTDLTGVVYIPKKMIGTGRFLILPKGDLYNGIKGYVDNIWNTKKLVIILGQKSMSKMKIKSKSPLSTKYIQQIVDSVRKCDCIPYYQGVTIDFSIEI